MNPKEAAPIVAGLLALGAALYVYDDLKDAPAKTEAEAKADGTRIEYNVYAVKSSTPDEATIYVVPQKDGGVAKLAQSPCARRPTGVKASECLRRLPDGGTYDFGDENTMQPGEFVGPGCKRTACVVFAGEAPETGPVK